MSFTDSPARVTTSSGIGVVVAALEVVIGPLLQVEPQPVVDAQVDVVVRAR